LEILEREPEIDNRRQRRRRRRRRRRTSCCCCCMRGCMRGLRYRVWRDRPEIRVQGFVFLQQD
jgi:hypothetical protein